MAFDRPIEADRIDDFNLFSAFVRAPLWLLGGVLGVHKSNTCSSEDEQLDGALPPLRNENQPPTNLPSSLRKHHDDSGRVTLATVASEDGSSSCSCLAEDQPVTDSLLGGRRKNLSWSDESGKSLVEYNDESVRHEPSPYSSSTTTSAPKSALRRSQSIKNDADTLSQLPDRTRYIPKMTAAKTSLILPTRPYDQHHGTGTSSHSTRDGVESPQLGYGFYMNLTPPTPEMYGTYPKSSTAHSRSSVHAAPHHPMRSSQNQVFQSLQNKSGAHQMGWTSVPI